MQRLFLALAGLGLAAGLGVGSAVAAPAKAAPAKAASGAAHGREIYVSYGCYQCHGYQGQGSSSAGPKLAPGPMPLDAFTRQMRNPRDRMPVYTSKVVSEGDLNDLYAYLQTIPKAKAVADIPLLNQ
ncbi:MAG: cytochrome c, mono- and diheme variant family [Caulobacteraceae bacterium]|nr:cytochrome c, mono- and diheme variant family [Caulobacteraceae bacterium]